MKTNRELAEMLIGNENISYGVIDPTVIYITYGTIDYDSGRCESYNSETKKWELSSVIYAYDPDKKFKKGMILNHKVSTIQFITVEDIEEMLYNGYLKKEELISFLEKGK